MFNWNSNRHCEAKKICNLKWWDSTGAFGIKKSTENLIHFIYYMSEIVAQIIVHIDYWWFKCKFITIKVWKEATIHCRNTKLNDGTQDEHYSRPWFIDVQNYATQRILLKASMCVRLFWGKSCFLFRNIDLLTVCKLYSVHAISSFVEQTLLECLLQELSPFTGKHTHTIYSYA